MALIIKDRVKEITTTTGTGDVSLGGASATFDAFQSVMSNGDTTFYAIVHTASGTDEWEVGVGTWNTGNTLTRTTVYAGSNGTSAVNFSSGNKDIFMTYPASKAAVAGEDVTFADITATDITATGTVTLSGDPTSALQAATKEYVDTIAAAGIHYHTPVRVETPSALTATYDNGTSGVGATLTNSGTQAALVIDGVTLSTSDRVLVYNQTNAAHNGIYTVTNTGSASTNWVLTRATDADSYGASDPDALGEGDAYFVKEGDTGAGELYVMNTSGVITFGTTAITFTVIAETAVYSAGTGLTLTGTTFSTNQDISTSASPTFNNITVTGTVDGRDVATDGSKLDGIEAGATADQTASEILTAIKTVDGSGSGLDADTVDGLQASSFLRSDAGDTASGAIAFTGEPRFGASYSDPDSGVQRDAKFGDNGIAVLGGIKTDTISITNDGAGSGIDADLLDGQQGSYYLNTGTTFSGDVSGTYNNIVVANDSHTHDGRYYTETEADSRFVNVTGDTMSGNLTISQGTSGDAILTIQADTDNSDEGDHPSIRLKQDGVYVDYRIGLGATDGDTTSAADSGNGLVITDVMSRGLNSFWYSPDNGSTLNKVFNDGYHPNADKWTTARTLSLSGDASGSVSWDGSANATLSVTVANDSHSHLWSNIAGNTRQNYSTALRPANSTNYAGFQFYNTAGSNAGYFLISGSGINNTSYQPDGISLIADAGWLSLVSRTTTNTGVRISTGATPVVRMAISDAGDIDFVGSSFEYNGNTIWHSANDGSGSGLDADNLDGRTWSTTRNAANTLVTRDSSGYTQLGWINTTSGATTSINKIYASADDYIRYVTPATFRSQVTDGSYVNVTGDVMTGALVLRGQVDDYDGNDRSSYWDYDGNVALALEPAADNGATAIIFKSVGNSPSDFGYIVYDEDYPEAGVTAGEVGALIISSQNDGTGSSDHVRVKSRLVVEADMSSSDPTYAFQVKSSNTTSDLFSVARNGTVQVGTSTVWHAGNDGANSGLDADLLDGIQGSNYLRSDVTDTFTTLSGTTLTANTLRAGDGTDGRFFSDTAGRTAFADGDFYLQTSVGNYYNYATNQYHGNTSGDNHYFRGNTLSGDGWSITGAGIATFDNHIIQEEGHYINLRFEMDGADNASPAYIILCRNAANNDVNGTIRMDRTSGLQHACSYDVIVSSGSSTNPIGIVTGHAVAKNGQPDARLVTATYGGNSYVALEVTNPDLYHETTGAYFTGRLVNSGSNTLTVVKASSLSSISALSGGSGGGHAVLPYHATIPGNLYLGQYIYHDGDVDTNIAMLTDNINIRTGGVDRVLVDGSGVRLGDSGNGYFRPVSGTYGSIEIDGGAHNNWEGYSIGGRAVFMHDNSSRMGLYDDVNNDWGFFYDFNGSAYLTYGGSTKLGTSSTGVTVTGTVAATSYTGDGSSLTGISAGATGGGSDEIFWENGQNVTSNYTITNGKNAMSAGPITINSGVTVTIGAGEAWTVV